jgi:hypothetical protein
MIPSALIPLGYQVLSFQTEKASLCSPTMDTTAGLKRMIAALG